MRPRHIEIGAGLSAAQALYARAESFIEPKKPRGRARTSDD